jgi:hypothetical protein
MDRPDFVAPGAGLDPDEYKPVPLRVGAFVALLFSVPLLLIVLLFLN